MSKTHSQTQAQDAMEALLLKGFVPVLTRQLDYISNGNEIYNISSRRELEALLRRSGVFRPTQILTRSDAANVSSALTTNGIQLSQWLQDRNHQTDLDALTSLWADYVKYGDWSDNDTRLRVLILDLVLKFRSDLLSTCSNKPANTSSHSVGILKQVAKKNATQTAVVVN